MLQMELLASPLLPSLDAIERRIEAVFASPPLSVSSLRRGAGFSLFLPSPPPFSFFLLYAVMMNRALKTSRFLSFFLFF